MHGEKDTRASLEAHSGPEVGCPGAVVSCAASETARSCPRPRNPLYRPEQRR